MKSVDTLKSTKFLRTYVGSQWYSTKPVGIRMALPMQLAMQVGQCMLQQKKIIILWCILIFFVTSNEKKPCKTMTSAKTDWIVTGGNGEFITDLMCLKTPCKTMTSAKTEWIVTGGTVSS